MSRHLIIINGNGDRNRAMALIAQVPEGTRVEFRASKRSLPQNARFWAALSDIARQVKWHGVKLRADDWKLIFMDALPRETRVAPNLNGDGFVNLGRSSRDLTREEMSDIIDLMYAFGANHGVRFNDGLDADVLDSTESDAIDRTVSA